MPGRRGSSLDQRTWLTLPAISLHELVPGHHFQMSLQLESEALPELLGNQMRPAYSEGWGSYASLLGLEAGIYDDPYARYGMYMLEIFLASRLVVDPGMNAFGWSLQRARQYMRDNTLESETQIASETLRYAADVPGQAVAYQMGKRAFLRLRRQAERSLGESFDLAEFHEVVLGAGAVPMEVLEGRVERWMDQRLQAPSRK